jgi:hypothetical protein
MPDFIALWLPLMRGTLTKPAQQPISAPPVSEALAAFEILADLGMHLVTLEFVERGDVGVLVVEMHHEADRHEPVAPVVHERAAAGVVLQRPAHAVEHKARLVLLGRHFPELFDADAELLRIALGAQLIAFVEDLRQRAARAFGEEDVFAVQFHAGLIIGLFLAVAANAEHASDDTFERAAFVEHRLGRGHAGIDFDAERFSLRRQPLRQVRERGDIVAVVVEQRRHKEHRQ